MDPDEIIDDCVETYQKQLEGASQTCKNIKDLQRAHTKLAKQAEQEFTSKCQFLEDASSIESYILQLHDKLQEILDEVLEITEWNQDEEEIVKEFRKLYFEQVDEYLKKNEFIQPSDLENVHEAMSNNAMAQCRLSQELTRAQEEELKKLVEESFEIFKTRNSMLLNFNKDAEAEPAIGIDLGTTFCCVGVFVKGKIKIIPNKLGHRTTPSYVRLEKNGQVTVGNTAKKNAYRYPDMTIFDAKRLIGRSFEDPIVQEDIKMWPFDVKKGESGPVIFANDKEYPPEQISAYLLQHLKKEAEDYLKVPVKKAVITVPAYFNDSQRQSTIDAGEMAGLQVLTILNEPTAAGMAYKMERIHEDTKKVLIFDFGGGTFDVALLQTSGTKIEVLAVDGDSHLGGEDIDRSLMKHCAKLFVHSADIDLLEDRLSESKTKRDKARACLRRMQTGCEESKIELSTALASEIAIDHLIDGHEMSHTFTREDLEALNEQVFGKIFEIIDRLLRTTSISKEEIDDIVLVGGSTRIPMVQAELKKYFNTKTLNYTINPDEAVAHGAAIHAAVLNGSSEARKLLNSTIQDVTPMSVGISSVINNVPGRFSIIIPKDAKIPTRKRKKFRTCVDDQTSVEIKIYQGEEADVDENILLGTFLLEGIPPAPALQEKLDVIMEIEGTGVLKVTAISKSTKGSQSLTIEEIRGRLPSDRKREITDELRKLEL